MARKSRHTALVFSAVLGLEAMLGGCATVHKKGVQPLEQVVDEQVVEEEQRVYSRLKIFSHDWQYLKEGEYMVPTSVLSVLSVVNGGGLSVKGGAYIVVNSLQDEDVQKQFDFLLRMSGFTQEEVAVYTRICSTEGNIIVGDMALFMKGETQHVLEHERYHKALHGLSSREIKILGDAYAVLVHQQLTKKQARRYGAKEGDLLIEGTIKDYGQDTARQEAERSGGEFYAYLGGDDYLPRVEEELRRQFPRAYRIHRSIKKAVELQMK